MTSHKFGDFLTLSPLCHAKITVLLRSSFIKVTTTLPLLAWRHLGMVPDLSEQKSIQLFYLHHIQRHFRWERTWSVQMFLWRVNVGPYKDFVVLAGLQLLVDKALVVEAVAQDESVGNGPLQELGGNVRQVCLVHNLGEKNCATRPLFWAFFHYCQIGLLFKDFGIICLPKPTIHYVKFIWQFVKICPKHLKLICSQVFV